jgi:hypothetical protein
MNLTSALVLCTACVKTTKEMYVSPEQTVDVDVSFRCFADLLVQFIFVGFLGKHSGRVLLGLGHVIPSKDG